MFWILKEKYNSESIRTPELFKKYRIKTNKWPAFKSPESLILCYDTRILDYIEKKYKLIKQRAFQWDFYILEENGKSVWIFWNFWLGSPMVATRVEELIEFWVKNIISIWEAWGIQSNLAIGDIVVCNKAIRNEWISHHYQKPSKYAYPSKILTKRIVSIFKKNSISYTEWSTWTMDAIYRQTIAEITKFQKDGVLSVEMELAAIFSIAKYRKVNAAGILTISDSLATKEWNPKFQDTTKSLGLIFEIAKSSLLSQ